MRCSNLSKAGRGERKMDLLPRIGYRGAGIGLSCSWVWTNWPRRTTLWQRSGSGFTAKRSTISKSKRPGEHRPTMSDPRRINARQAASDFRSGMSEAELMGKFQVSAKGLESLARKLVEAGLLIQSELDTRFKIRPCRRSSMDVPCLWYAR